MIKNAPKNENWIKDRCVGDKLKIPLKVLIKISFITVINPHIKNNEVNNENALE